MSAAVAGSSDRAILAFKHWCNAALDVDRQWKHLTAVDIHGELPGEAMIEAKKIPEDAKPSDPVVPDSGHAELGQNRRGRGRGRGRAIAPVDTGDGGAGRGRRGRGRGRGRAIAPAAGAADAGAAEQNVASSGDRSSSSSSNSSSSSSS